MLVGYCIVAILVIGLSVKNMIRMEQEKGVQYTMSEQFIHGSSVIVACLLFGLFWPIFLIIAVVMQIIRLCEHDLFDE